MTIDEQTPPLSHYLREIVAADVLVKVTNADYIPSDVLTKRSSAVAMVEQAYDSLVGDETYMHGAIRLAETRRDRDVYHGAALSFAAELGDYKDIIGVVKAQIAHVRKVLEHDEDLRAFTERSAERYRKTASVEDSMPDPYSASLVRAAQR
jgi:hypothetical protein